MLKPSLLVLLLCGTVIQAAQPEKKEVCDPTSHHMRTAVRHIEAGGIGYNKGYTTLEAFFASDPTDWSVMPFLDLRAHVFNDGKFAWNSGIGGRANWGCRAYGIYGYYDYRKTHHRSYNQVSLGLETLGDLWDLRINGYLPVGGKVSNAYDVGFAGFEGHSILVNRKYEYAMKGVDGEMGFHFGKTGDFDFYAAAGPYYFKGEMGKGAVGGKARIAGYYKEYVTLELSDSYDTVFRNNVQGQLTFTLPFGNKSKPKMTTKNCPDTCDFGNTLAQRMTQPVGRQEIVVVDTHRKKTATSDVVFFVNNLSSSAGTFESPYPTLAQALSAASEGDIIYVYSGDGTSTGLDGGATPFTLQNNQKVLGSGASHTLSTNLGTITIPVQSILKPYITANGGVNVFEVANRNTLSGLEIVAADGMGTNWAIGSSNMVDNLTLSNNIIHSLGANSRAISLQNDVSGTLSVNNNYIVGDGASLYGLIINNSANSATRFVMSNNTMSGFDARGVEITSSSGTFTGVVTGNEFLDASGNDAFLYTGNSSSSSNFSFTNNLISGEEGIGFFLNGDAEGVVTLNNNKIYTFETAVSIQTSDDSLATAYVYNNEISSDGDGNQAVEFRAFNNTSITATVENNNIAVASDDDESYAVYGDTNGAATLTIDIQNNILTAAGYAEPYGVYLESSADMGEQSTLTATVIGNSIKALDGDEDGTGVYARSFNDTIMNVIITNNTILASEYGLDIQAGDESELEAVVNKNKILLTNNSNAGIRASSFGQGLCALSGSSNDISGFLGLEVRNASTGVVTVSLSDSELAGYSGAALFVSNTGGGDLTLSLTSSELISSAPAVVVLETNNSSSTNFEFEENRILGPQFGVDSVLTDAGSTIIARVIDNLSTAPNGDAFTAQMSSDGASCVSYQNNVGINNNAFINNGTGTFTLYYNGNNQSETTMGTITPGTSTSCELP